MEDSIEVNSAVENHKNWSRLSLAIKLYGKDAIVDYMHKKLGVPTDPKVLCKWLQNYRKVKKNNIAKYIWDNLFHQCDQNPCVHLEANEVHLKELDITSLKAIYLNIEHINPDTCSNKCDNQTEEQAKEEKRQDIEDLKLESIKEIFDIRNHLAHHASVDMDETTFDKYWNQIRKALIEMGFPVNKLDILKTCSLEPHLEKLCETLAEYYSDLDNKCDKADFEILEKNVEASINAFGSELKQELKKDLDRLKEDIKVRLSKLEVEIGAWYICFFI